MQADAGGLFLGNPSEGASGQPAQSPCHHHPTTREFIAVKCPGQSTRKSPANLPSMILVTMLPRRSFQFYLAFCLTFVLISCQMINDLKKHPEEWNDGASLPMTLHAIPNIRSTEILPEKQKEPPVQLSSPRHPKSRARLSYDQAGSSSSGKVSLGLLTFEPRKNYS
jgi:hypothetical protein